MKINELFPDVLLEDTSYEFKARLNPDNPLKWAKAFVAFSNGDGGYIFVGVNNERDAFGLSIGEIDETKNLIALVNNRSIFPHARYSFQIRSVDGGTEKFVLAIKVLPSDSIVCYRDGDFRETVYLKGDANAVPANPGELISLGKRKYGVDNSFSDIEYDEEAWTAYNALCREYREDKLPPSLEQLQSMGIVSAEGNASTGLLMFKDDYDGDDTLVHCYLFMGSDKSAPVLSRDEFKGSLAHTFKKAMEFMHRNSRNGYYKQGARRVNTHSYPELALREAMVNAIAHRDYSIRGTQIDVNIYDDRIEITSPGSWMLPKPFEEYDLLKVPSIRRNQVICACLDVANLMERGGTGFRAIWDSYSEEAEDRQPSVSAYPGFFIISLPELSFPLGKDKAMETKETSGKKPALSLTPEMETVINLLSEGSAGISKLQEACKKKNRYKFIKDVINPLLINGIIERVGNPKSKYSYFVLKR